jgi:hypothetical protein
VTCNGIPPRVVQPRHGLLFLAIFAKYFADFVVKGLMFSLLTIVLEVKDARTTQNVQTEYTVIAIASIGNAGS